MRSLEIAQVLDDAADLIDKHGLAQGAYFATSTDTYYWPSRWEDGMHLDAAGAIAVALGKTELGEVLEVLGYTGCEPHEVVSELLDWLGLDTAQQLGEWSDDPARLVLSPAVVLRELAANLRERVAV